MEVTCRGNKTNSIDMCFDNYGCHTYERTSYPISFIGPFKLNRTLAEPDPSSDLFTMFRIETVIMLTYSVGETVHITGWTV